MPRTVKRGGVYRPWRAFAGVSRRDGVFRFFFTFFGGLLAKITPTHGDRYMEKGAGALALADSVYAAASVTMEYFCTHCPFSPREEEEDGMP